MEKILIVGSGPAGLTAAIYSARARHSPVVLSGEIQGGQLTQTSDIENYPGFEDPVNGFEFMMTLKKQAERFGAKIVSGVADSVDLVDGGPQKVILSDGQTLVAQSLIIATGASPRWLGLESESRLLGKGVSACATCDGAFFRNMDVVVVGGGDTAMEEALFLSKFASSVTVIHRRDQLRASKIMAERAMKNPKISFIWDSVVTDILGQKEVSGVMVKNLKTDQMKEIKCSGYFAALGHIPNTKIFKGSIELDEEGYVVLADKGSSRTNKNGVFVAGDCADRVYRQAVTAAGMGCRAAIDAERWLESL